MDKRLITGVAAVFAAVTFLTACERPKQEVTQPPQVIEREIVKEVYVRDFCKLSSPWLLRREVLVMMDEVELQRFIDHNELGERKCGWEPTN